MLANQKILRNCREYWKNAGNIERMHGILEHCREYPLKWCESMWTTQSLRSTLPLSILWVLVSAGVVMLRASRVADDG